MYEVGQSRSSLDGTTLVFEFGGIFQAMHRDVKNSNLPKNYFTQNEPQNTFLKTSTHLRKSSINLHKDHVFQFAVMMHFNLKSRN